jgi:hypothetical protein
MLLNPQNREIVIANIGYRLAFKQLVFSISIPTGTKHFGCYSMMQDDLGVCSTLGLSD